MKVGRKVGKKMAGNGFELVIVKMGQTLSGKLDCAVPSVGERVPETSQLVDYERAVERRVVGYEGVPPYHYHKS